MKRTIVKGEIIMDKLLTAFETIKDVSSNLFTKTEDIITFNQVTNHIATYKHPRIFARHFSEDYTVFFREGQVLLMNDSSFPRLLKLKVNHLMINPAYSNEWVIYDQTLHFEGVIDKLRSGHTIYYVDLKGRIHPFNLGDQHKIPFNWLIQKRWYAEEGTENEE